MEIKIRAQTSTTLNNATVEMVFTTKNKNKEVVSLPGLVNHLSITIDSKSHTHISCARWKPQIDQLFKMEATHRSAVQDGSRT